MSAAGHVLVSAGAWSALATTLRQTLDLPQAAAIRQNHQQRLQNLLACAYQATTAGEAANSPADCQAAWTALAQAIAEMAPYGLVTKILPPVLLERLPAEETIFCPQESGVELFPRHLSSGALVEGVAALLRQLQAAPGVEAMAAELSRFCRSYIGHGPKPWEEPGYEEPRYLLEHIIPPPFWPASPGQTASSLRALLDAENVPPLLSPPTFIWEEQPAPLASSWQQEVDYWSEQLDTQTTIMRWAFLAAEMPLLSRLAAHWLATGTISQASDLFYSTRHEIGRFPPALAEIEQRRAAYQQLIRQAGRADLTGAADARFDLHPSLPLEPAGDSIAIYSRPAQPAALIGEVVLWGQSVSSTELRCGPAWLAGSSPTHLPAQPGVVVTARHLPPDLTPALLRAAAVVVEEGGLLQHASIVAREINIPCVVGCRGLLEQVTPGMIITVDGRDGRVTIRGGERLTP
jgi:phosphohistidine swiveling domain-containing protein